MSHQQVQCISVWPEGPRGTTLSGGPRDQPIFLVTIGHCCLFHYNDICMVGAKAVVSEPQHESRQWYQTVFRGSLLFTATYSQKQSNFKIINFMNLNIQVHLFSVFGTMKCEAHERTINQPSKHASSLKESIVRSHLSIKLN